MNSLQGQLLIASPQLRDPNFFRSVVLIVQHNSDGALGVILNRATNTTVKQLWEAVNESPCVNELPLHLGGPVEGPLMAVHRDESLSEIEIIPGAYFSAEPAKLEQFVSQPTDHAAPLRFFVGCSGWGEGQLERELDEDAWVVAPATLDFIFGNDSDLWERATRAAADAKLVSVLHIKHVPTDPSLN
jgi:putative transcriptional regulator